MSKIVFKCEANPDNLDSCANHPGPIFYCSLCNVSICTSCLISHLCLKPHNDPKVVQTAEVAINEAKNKFKQLETSLNQNYEDLSKTNNNELLGLLINKKKENNDNFRSLYSQLQKVQNAINYNFDKQIEELNEKKVQNSSAKLSNTIMNDFTNLSRDVSSINKKLNKDEIIGSDVVKEISILENKISTFLSKIDAEKKSDKGSNYYTKKLASIKNIISNLDIKNFFNEIKNFVELNQLKINFQNGMANYFGEDVEMRDQTNTQPQNKQPVNNLGYHNQPNNTTSNYSKNPSKNSIPAGPRNSIQDNSQMPIYQQPSRKIPDAPVNSYGTQSKEESDNSSKNKQKYIYPYVSEYLIYVKIPDGKSQNDVIVFNPVTHSCTSIPLSKDQFVNCYSPHFPFRNCKFTNIGNNSLILTGGFVETTMTNKVFRLSVDHELKVEITLLKPLRISRQGHNILYLPKKNFIVVCGGQSLNSSEYIDLSKPESEWISMPNMKKIRANATMFVVNDTYVYCVGGYNHSEEKYQSGYEMINCNKMSDGWKEVMVEELAISTMGVIMMDYNKVLLLGGFKGGKRYLNEGLLLTINDKTKEIEHIDKKEGIMKRGAIFYCSQQFFNCEDSIVNIDFKTTLLTFNKDLLAVTIGETFR